MKTLIVIFFAILASFIHPSLCVAAPELPYKVFRDLNYVPGGKNQAQTLDLYLPKKQKPAAGYPVVVAIHGGGFTSGDKAFPPCLDDFSRAGFVVASVNHRFLKEASYPAQLYDVKASIRWLRSNASKYGINSKKFGAIGGSSGGQLASLLGSNNFDAALEGRVGVVNVSSGVSAVCDLAGPTNMFSLDLPEKFLPAKGILMKPSIHLYPSWGLACSMLKNSPSAVPELAKLASPIFWISKKSAAFLIFHGTKDIVVPFRQSVEFDEILKQNGVSSQLVLVPDRGHGDLGAANLDARILGFFKKQLIDSH